MDGCLEALGIRISLLTRIFFAAMTLVPSLATALVYGITRGGEHGWTNGNMRIAGLVDGRF